MEQSKQAKKPKKKGIIIAVIIILVLALIAVGVTSCVRSISQSLQNMTGEMLETVEVERRDISNDINVSGSVESENLVKVTSTVTGKIEKLYVELGSEVKAGDILCEFDSSDLQQQYDSLARSISNSENLQNNTHKANQRNLNNAKAEKSENLAQAQRSINEAVKNRDDAYAKENDLVAQYNEQVEKSDEALTGMQEAEAEEDAELYGKYMEDYQEAQAMMEALDNQIEAIREQLPTYDNAVQSAVDAYNAAARSANSMIDSYQDVLDNEPYSMDTSAQEQLDKLAEQIADCTVKAPKSGIITSLNVAEGSIPTTDALMTIEDKDALKITVQISEADILKLHEGLPAVVKTNATGDQEFEAVVSRVVNIYKTEAPSALTGSSSGGYSAEITVKDKDSSLLIGMNAKVRIILDEKKDVLAVPYESIVEDEDGSHHVIIAEFNEKGTATAKLAKVEPGMEGSYYTEITSTEVKEGDKIVMSGGDFKDGEILPLFDFAAAMNNANGGDADE